jgi:hypothetical protein
VSTYSRLSVSIISMRACLARVGVCVAMHLAMQRCFHEVTVLLISPFVFIASFGGGASKYLPVSARLVIYLPMH